MAVADGDLVYRSATDMGHVGICINIHDVMFILHASQPAGFVILTRFDLFDDYLDYYVRKNDWIKDIY